ncbi:SusC/RagA family TonB-linked outer membrane protein [Sphingobacterium mizutaii NBRC 14946 = DSM 11724]|uniref:Outer membrane cobalamin receptor protein n=2 Tax=Sphingobacterium mizutaii TaxID=1010 RepID=A0AAJ4X9K1_9SPHI|nr:SusC/RagA family TonB-linked outer membrane protein [Sphingobacterium mizutaii]GEM69445.1 SusC/RagA family TonB-linked outer membrane protein [Sphingobacterium mizutaii NBRC 14946 = DSM 11724]SDL72808.1 TonB-linked outer membrane protein, SusC/RagA family [Sphingobacterium mizutaii]SNV41172.1 Outer membrane cobalamin receptor protein [Sphingobacterium mizutaii]
MKTFIMLMVSILVSVQVHAQQIRGKVLNQDNQPIVGASIRNLSTTIATQTNQDGEFIIGGQLQQRLEASSIGYERKQVTVTQNDLTIILVETSSTLEEAVVIGYQTVTRKKATAAISSISGKELENLPAASFDMLLQGRLAGVNVQNFSGAPGASPTLSVRGTSALSTQYSGDDYYNVISSPLYVIDGVPQPTEQFVSPNTGTGTNYLAGLNPNDIESIDVLRDASAAAIYGSRAANGVVMITTKKGRSGEPRVIITGYSGMTQRPELREVTLGRIEREQKLDIIRRQVSINDQKNLPKLLTDSLNPAFNGHTDWQDLFYQSGKVNNANLSLSGGGNSTTYRFSGDYFNEEGIVKATGFQRYSGRLNLATKAIQERLTINPIVSYSYNARNRGNGNSVSPIALGAGNMPTSLLNLSQKRADFLLGQYEDNLDVNRNTNFNTNLNLSLVILPGLTFTSQSAYIVNESKRDYNRPSMLTSGAGNYSYSVAYGDSQLRISNILSYNKQFNKHSLSILLGQEAEKNKIDMVQASGSQGVSDQIQVVNGFLQNNIGAYSDLQRYSLLSYLTRVSYDFDSKYLFSGAFRADGSSRFGANNKWGYFPSASVGWIISEEDFLKDHEVLTLLKLRGSYGLTGALPTSNYLQYNLYDVNAGGFAGSNGSSSYNGQVVVMPNFVSGVAQKNLSWQKNRQWNAGLDIELLRGRFSMMIDVFNKENYEGLFDVELPLTTGYDYAKTNSVGIRNSGVDVQFSADVLSRESAVKWRSNFNISYVKNRIMNLPNAGRDLVMGGDRFDKSHILSVGSPINAFYLYNTLGVFSTMDDIPVNPNTGERYRNSNGTFNAGDFYFQDLDGDYFIDIFNSGINPDKIPMGDPNFKWVGGWNNVFSYKDFTLTFQFNYGFDRDVLNLFESDQFSNSTSGDPLNNFIFYSTPNLKNLNMWRNPGDQAEYAKYDLGTYRYYYTSAQSFFLESGSYVRWKNFIVSYNLPSNLLKSWKLSNLRVFGIMDNVLMWQQSKKLPDAEAVNPYGEYNGAGYPIPRKYTIGLELTL